MNIRRYVAPDMRTAFKLVRDELGPDVVILSTRRIKGKIELTVASDQSAPQPSLAVKQVNFPVLGATSPLQADSPIPEYRVTPTAEIQSVPAVASSPIREIRNSSPIAVDDELRALRRLLETQLASLAWNDLSRRTPAMAEMTRELSEAGFSKDFISGLIDSVPEAAELANAREIINTAIRSRLLTTGDLWTERGGTIVVVGPAGAGKTTALAALAARWVMHHGTNGAVLISAGESRFGAHENLSRVGRLVGVPVHALSSLEDLPALLTRLVDRRLVLVDTAGVGPRNDRFESHLHSLQAAMPDAQFALALSASSQSAVLREVIAGYRKLERLSCVISHLDECVAMGGTLSALIENAIPIAYTVSGPRLLDDFRPARPETLLQLCEIGEGAGLPSNREVHSNVA